VQLYSGKTGQTGNALAPYDGVCEKSIDSSGARLGSPQLPPRGTMKAFGKTGITGLA
jgi:hypothetical protein